MEFAMREWLTIVIVLLIIGVLLDGIRRMRQARRNSLRMSLSMHKGTTQQELDEYGSELPNGGARVAVRNEAQEVERLNRAMHQIVDPDDVIMQDKSSPVEQASLNLEQSVPMLMDSVESAKQDKTDLSTDEPDTGELTPSELTNNERDAAGAERIEPQINPDAAVTAVADDTPDARSLSTTDTGTETTPQKPPPKTAAIKVGNPFKQGAAKPERVTETKKAANHGLKEEVFIINVKAIEGQQFDGSALLSIMLEEGLRFGAMNIFHCHSDDDGEGPILYSLANMVMPGTFDLNAMDNFSTPGVSLFLTLPIDQYSYLNAFESMLNTAKRIAQTLGGELKDEHRSVMTGQTIEHYRERIRDFTRKQQLAAKI